MSDATIAFDLESPTAFAAVLGGYVAALVVPVGLAFVPGPDAPIAQQYAGVLVAGPVVALAAGAGLRGVAEPLGRRLGGTQTRWLLVPLPFAHFLLGIEGVVPLGPGLVGAAAGLLLGIVVGVMAGNRHVRARYGGSHVAASFAARWATRRRRVTVGAAVGWLVLWAATVVALGVDGPALALLNVGGPVTAAAIGGTGERTYQVTADGLVRRTPVAATVLSWDRFEWFGVTEDALVLRRRFWTTRLDRDDIEDVVAVEAALSDHLPQRDP